MMMMRGATAIKDLKRKRMAMVKLEKQKRPRAFQRLKKKKDDVSQSLAAS